MATDILKAEVAIVQVGCLELEGLLLEDGTFAVGVPQIANVFPTFQDDQNQAAKKLKRLMGASFKTTNTKTEFNRNKTLAVSLVDFEKVLLRLYKKDDKIAEVIVHALAGLSLHQLFCDAFKIRFEAEDRQSWLKVRSEGKTVRRRLCDSIRDWYIRNPGKTSCPQHAMYAKTTNAVYQALWGMDAIALETYLGCDRNKSRDYLSAKDLRQLERAEERVMEYIDEDNIKPIDAVPLANLRRKTLD